MNAKKGLSVIVPTLNEAGNIDHLLQRLHQPLQEAKIPYEVIIVDDHSSDDTVKVAENLAMTYPVITQMKQGKRGKAYSLLEGFDHAKHELVAMIDADLQYPPEEIAAMYELLDKSAADVVVTERHNHETNRLRQLSTKVYNLVFARLLFGIRYDTQSGLKLFKKRILNDFDMAPSPWTFDLEFLVRALENKFKIVSHHITFYERTSGVTKIKLLSATSEMVMSSLRLRWNTSARRVREGHRLNDNFLKKAFPAAVLVFVLGISMIGSPMQANAISTPDALRTIVTPANNANKPKSATPTTPQSDQSKPLTPDTANTTQPTTSTPQVPATNTPVSSTTTTQPAVSVKSAPIATSTSTPQLNAQASAAASSDHSKLAAVTNSNGAGVYGTSEQVPSAQTVHSLLDYSRIGLIAGIGLVLLSVVLLTKDNYKKFIAERSTSRYSAPGLSE